MLFLHILAINLPLAFKCPPPLQGSLFEAAQPPSLLVCRQQWVWTSDPPRPWDPAEEMGFSSRCLCWMHVTFVTVLGAARSLWRRLVPGTGHPHPAPHSSRRGCPTVPAVWFQAWLWGCLRFLSWLLWSTEFRLYRSSGK